MKYTITLLFLFSSAVLIGQNKEDAILGKWESADKNLIVDVYKQNDAFRAKVVWFYDEDDTITPIQQRLDIKNPNKALRSRPIIGADILSGLEYDSKKKKWTGGRIYDATSGKTWDASVWLNGPASLSVRGFYLVRWLGKTLNFRKL